MPGETLSAEHLREAAKVRTEHADCDRSCDLWLLSQVIAAAEARATELEQRLIAEEGDRFMATNRAVKAEARATEAEREVERYKANAGNLMKVAAYAKHAVHCAEPSWPCDCGLSLLLKGTT